MEHPSLEVTPLCRNRLVCILPDNHALTRRATLTLADLRPYPLIAYERDTPLGVIVTEMYQADGEPLDPAIEVGSPHNAVALVQMGAGVALVDEFSARSWSASSPLAVRRVDNAPLLNVNLVHMRFEPLSQLTQAFIAQLKQLVKQQNAAAQ
jgi:DNA-binding transcriptional LysR family regulator